MAPTIWSTYELDETTYEITLGEYTYLWRIKAPTFADERKLAALFGKRPVNTTWEIAADELALTFGGTTLPHASSPTFDPDDPSFVPALKVSDDAETIKNYLNSIPTQVVREMWSKVKDVAPNWGPEFRRP